EAHGRRERGLDHRRGEDGHAPELLHEVERAETDFRHRLYHFLIFSCAPSLRKSATSGSSLSRSSDGVPSIFRPLTSSNTLSAMRSVEGTWCETTMSVIPSRLRLTNSASM